MYGAVRGAAGASPTRSTPYWRPYQGAGGGGSGAAATLVEGKTELVNRVKALQRGGGSNRDKWIRYCEIYGTVGRVKHDPNTHSEEFLRQFFADLESGVIPNEDEQAPTGGATAALAMANGSPDSKEMLVQRVKQVQRASPEGKHKWIVFCESRGQKKHDPNVHEANFLMDFFVSMERGDLPDDPSGKIELAQKIKEMQRKDPDGKQRWADYCDRFGHGKHDPNIYDAAFLRAFLENPDAAPGGVGNAADTLQQKSGTSAQSLQMPGGSLDMGSGGIFGCMGMMGPEAAASFAAMGKGAGAFQMAAGDAGAQQQLQQQQLAAMQAAAGGAAWPQAAAGVWPTLPGAMPGMPTAQAMPGGADMAAMAAAGGWPQLYQTQVAWPTTQ